MTIPPVKKRTRQEPHLLLATGYTGYGVGIHFAEDRRITFEHDADSILVSQEMLGHHLLCKIPRGLWKQIVMTLAERESV